MPMTITRRPGLLSYVNDGTSNVWYDLGLEKPNFPVPAIPLQVVWPDADNNYGYKDMIFIDDVSDPDDPVMVCCWDHYDGPNRVGVNGEYTRMDYRR